MKCRHSLIIDLILGLAVVAFGSHPYITDPGTLLEGFEDVSDWDVVGEGASAENDTDIFKFGSQSIKLNAVNGGIALLNKTVSLDLSNGDGFSYWIYVPDKTIISNPTLYITSVADYTKYFSKSYYVGTNGWNHVTLSKSEFDNTNGESWDNTMVRVRFTLVPKIGEDASIYFDDLRFGIVGLPKVIITFDDGSDGQINNAYPIMSANGQAGVVFAPTSWVGLANRLTLDNLQTLKTAGWDISNHTATHLNLTTASQEEMEADIDGGYDWLVVNGFGNTAKFFGYPYAAWNDAVVAKLKQKHVLARGPGCAGHFDVLNFDDLQYKLSSLGLAYNISVATVQTRIDETIEKSGLLIMMFHDIVDSGTTGNEYLTADFQAISDYLKAKQDAGLLEVITFSDYYNALIRWHRLEPEPFCPEMDFNGDCKVDWLDFAIFARSWLECNLEPECACWE